MIAIVSRPFVYCLRLAQRLFQCQAGLNWLYRSKPAKPEKEGAMPSETFHHVTDPVIRAALLTDPQALKPAFIRAIAEDALHHAEIDLGDPDVHNAGERMELAKEAFVE